VTGGFTGTVEFGAGQLTATMNASNVFLPRYTPMGGVTSVGQFGGGDTIAFDVTTDGGGSPILVGYYSGVVDFGDGPLPMASPGGFIAKLVP
jgi:hypothetical protein